MVFVFHQKVRRTKYQKPIGKPKKTKNNKIMSDEMGSCAGISSESLYVFLFFLFSHWFLIFVPSHLLVSFVFLLFSHGLLRFRGLHCLLLILFLCTCGCVSAISSCRNELPPESKRGGEREREHQKTRQEQNNRRRHKNTTTWQAFFCVGFSGGGT